MTFIKIENGKLINCMHIDTIDCNGAGIVLHRKIELDPAKDRGQRIFDGQLHPSVAPQAVFEEICSAISLGLSLIDISDCIAKAKESAPK